MRFQLFPIITVFFVFMIAGAPAGADEIKIGAIFPLSGELANLGKKLRDGISMAVQDAGGGGFRVIFEDGTLQKQNMITAYRKLRSSDHVRFVIGPFGPDQALVIAPEAKKENVLLVAVSLCESRFFKFDNLFCLFPKSQEQLQPLLLMLDLPDIQTVAYLGEELRGFQQYHRSIRAAARARKKPLLLDRNFQSQESDFCPLLTRLRPAGVDLLIVGGVNMRAVATAFKQARELGLHPKARWFLSEHDPQFFQQNRDLLEGAYSLAIPPVRGDFQQRFKGLYGYLPDLYSALVYDGTKMLLEAIRSGPEDEMSSIASRMVDHPLSGSATSSFAFNTDRTVRTKVAVTRINDGAIGFVQKQGG